MMISYSQLKTIFPSMMAQALFGLNHMIMLILGALSAAYILSPNDMVYSTFPPGMMLLSAFCMTPFAGSVLEKFGNRKGFFIGIFANVMGAFLFALALLEMNFTLLILASLGFGTHQAFAGYLRFAVTEESACCQKTSAMAMTIGGGTLAAMLAPFFIAFTQDITLPTLYLGTLISLTAVNILGCLIPPMMHNNALYAQEVKKKKITLSQIITRKGFLPASISGLTANAIMHFIVLAAPLAMIGCGLTQTDASVAIQGHMLAMIIPSFIAGTVTAKLGQKNTLLSGLFLMGVACLFFLLGSDNNNLIFFQMATLFLGFGWGLTYITSGSLLMCCYCPCDRTGVQSANEMIITGGSALLSLFTGAIYTLWGANSVAIIAISLIIVALVVVTFGIEEGTQWVEAE